MYREDVRVNQSLLKKVLDEKENALRAYNSFEATEATRIGNAADCRLTSEDFNDLYYVMTFKPPGGKLGDAVMKAFELFGADLDDKGFDYACDEADYKSPKLLKSRWVKFEKEGKPYYEALLEAESKTILSPEENEKAEQCVWNFTKGTLSWLFSLDDRLTVEFQKEVYGEIEGIECKGLMDILISNETNDDIEINSDYTLDAGCKLIVDIKTGYQHPRYLGSYIFNNRTDFQLAFYKDLLDCYDSETVDCMVAYTSYNFEEGSWCLIPQKHINNAYFGSLRDPEMSVDLHPNTYSELDLYKRPGIIQALHMYKIYEETNWNEDVLLRNSNSQIKLW